jgi:3-oxoacyl-[acyl-carrier protein] reductase
VEIKNNNIVITGGAQGLGFAMAEKFASLGANIALIDMQQDVLDTAVSALSKHGTKVMAYAAKVTDEEAVVATFRKCRYCSIKYVLLHIDKCNVSTK